MWPRRASGQLFAEQARPIRSGGKKARAHRGLPLPILPFRNCCRLLRLIHGLKGPSASLGRRREGGNSGRLFPRALAKSLLQDRRDGL